MNEPELTDDAVVELAREGGLAFMPALSGKRQIVIAQLSAEQRQRLVEILHQALPLGQPRAARLTRTRRSALLPCADNSDRCAVADPGKQSATLVCRAVARR